MWAALASGSLLVLCAPAADAQDAGSESEYGASAQVVRPVAARNEEDATAAATSVELTKRPLALETLREVIPEIPGALALSSGGYGAFSSVSLRGTDLGQTIWLLGDVPLNGPDSGAFDMSLLPLPQLAKLEVYRGGAPVWLGQGSIGGVIRVVPREADGTGANAQAGLGSFGRYEARASSYVRRFGRRPISLYSGVQVAAARNDYAYPDDNGTRLGPNSQDDDVERRLKNADLLDGTGLLHMRAAALGGHVDGIVYGIGRTGGVPGSGGLSNNATRTRRELSRGLVSLAYTREGKNEHQRRYRLQVLASGQGERRDMYDPLGEVSIGGPSDSEQKLARITGRIAGSLEVTRVLEATLLSTYAGDRIDEDDALQVTATGVSKRHTEAAALELRLFGRVFGLRSELRGSVRAEFTQTELSVLRVSRSVDEKHRLNSQVYRLADLLELFAGFSLRGSVGTGKRVPSILELFGDGAAFVPNPKLTPESGRYADAGFVWSDAFRHLCLVLEINGFWSKVDDKIVQVSNGNSTIAKNLGFANVLGTELGGELSYHRFIRLVSAATFMQSEAPFERQLPRQPKFRAYGRVESSVFFDGFLRRVTAFATVDHVSTSFFDAPNEALNQPWTHVGFGAAFGMLDERLELQARVSDAFDTRGQDYLRLPLPGRFFGLLLSVKEESR